MQQFSFDFPLPVDYAASDFVLSGANYAAHTWVNAWPAWNSYGLLVYGPSDCGKTHLAHLWKMASGAQLLPAASLNESLLPELLSGPAYYVVEDIERIAEEPALFHLLNHISAKQGAILLTAITAPNHLNFLLPDLRSRLNALPTASIAPPDDALLKAVLHKQFTDRQLRVSEETVEFLLSRMERSFAMAKHVVNHLDRQALLEQCNITIPFVKRVLL